jgi:hypothetical protein
MKTTILVADPYRTNALSLVPGGSTVVTVLSDGSKRSYNKVKDPQRYANTVRKDPAVFKILVDGKLYWERQ